MKQTNIYDYIGIHEDPLYNIINNLKANESLFFGEFEVKLNRHGIYEILSPNLHEAFGTAEKCYEAIMRIYDQRTY